MKKICFLLGNAKGDGGIARVVSIIANELADLDGFDISILSLSTENGTANYYYKPQIHHYVLYNKDTSMSKAMLFKHAIADTKKILHNNDIDVLLACGDIFFPLGILSTRGMGTRCICWEHSDPKGVTDHKFQKQCREIAVKKADKILVLTQAAKNIYINSFNANPKKVEQIYNPISDKAFVSEEYDVNSQKIISVGRLHHQKNFELSIEIAKDILPSRPQWSWEIYGEGRERDRLTKLIRDYDIQEQVHLMGQRSNLYEVYGKYAFQVMTSRHEGFPMTLLEGSANRLPLVAFDVPTGPSEIIENGTNGFLVKNGEIETMRHRIVELIDNKALREKMSEASINKVKEFEIDKIVAQWRVLCQE